MPAKWRRLLQSFDAMPRHAPLVAGTLLRHAVCLRFTRQPMRHVPASLLIIASATPEVTEGWRCLSRMPSCREHAARAMFRAALSLRPRDIARFMPRVVA